MKQIFMLLSAAILCSTTALAQHTSDIPNVVKSAFDKSYVGASKIKWDKEDSQYEVNFYYQNHEMSVLYNANGTVSETETEITADELPAIAKKYASSKGTIKEAAKIIKADGTLQYEAQVKGRDLMFDSKGVFINEKLEK